jgi:2-polyprenyl-3-methyl-5-hydroxy-6-metoxy-1,4-benzoquinol methylase
LAMRVVENHTCAALPGPQTQSCIRGAKSRRSRQRTGSEELEFVRCSICDADDTETFLQFDTFAYRRCRVCGLVYQNPRPVFRDLKERYRDNYFEYEVTNQENFFQLMKLGLRDIGFDKLFPTVKGDRCFLDIGCATGLLLNHMQKKGWDCRGVELCRESAEYGVRRFGLTIFIGTLEQASFPKSFFDAVHLSHLIEHVPDPRGLLFEIRRILKPEGHLILTTPNVDGLQARIARERWRSAIPDHVYLFSKKTMRSLLFDTGYTILKQISWGGIPVGKRPACLKKPADRLAKRFNLGDVMLFHCTPA